MIRIHFIIYLSQIVITLASRCPPKIQGKETDFFLSHFSQCRKDNRNYHCIAQLAMSLSTAKSDLRCVKMFNNRGEALSQTTRIDEEPRPYRWGFLTIQAALEPPPARPGAAHTAGWWPR